MAKTYLGDSVYADVENGMVVLTTENGLGPSNTIYMEPEVVAAFDQWREQLEWGGVGRPFRPEPGP